MAGRRGLALANTVFLLALAGCGRLGFEPSDVGTDAVALDSGGLDSGEPDSGVPDSGEPTDGSNPDGSPSDATADAGDTSTMTDGATDGGGECVIGAACTPVVASCLSGTTTCFEGVAACTMLESVTPGTVCGSGTCDGTGICDLESGSLVSATSTVRSLGFSLATDGTRVAAGAWNPRYLTESGRVVVFENGASGWAEAAYLRASDAAPNDGFGSSVAIQGETMLIGARRRRVGTRYAGAIYVFERIAGAWTEIQIIEPPNAEAINFGSDVAIDGTRAVATAHIGMIGGGWGSGYILERNADATWTVVATMTSPGADSLGWSADIDGDRVVLGSLWTTDPSGSSSSDGAVHVFERAAADSWTETATLFPPTPAPPAGWYSSGSEVVLDGNRIAMGDALAEITDRSNGAIMIWELVGGTWTPMQTLTDTVINRDASFGRSIILQGDTLITSSIDYIACNVRVSTFQRLLGTWQPIRVNVTPPAIGCNDGEAVEGYYVDLDVARVAGQVMVGYPIASGTTSGPGALVVTTAE